MGMVRLLVAEGDGAVCMDGSFDADRNPLDLGADGNAAFRDLSAGDRVLFPRTVPVGKIRAVSAYRRDGHLDRWSVAAVFSDARQSLRKPCDVLATAVRRIDL